jgi:cobalt-zinc-cadmium efflux system protein
VVTDGSHAHAGDAHDHHHAPSRDADRRLLSAALAVLLTFMAAEVVAGLVARSLALLSDAAHMLTDAAAIVLALAATRLALRPATGRMTYGWRRVEILAAQANGLTLLLLAAWLSYAAVRRLIEPADVHGVVVLLTALAGIAVNLLATWLLAKADRTSLNVEGAFQHVLTDLYAFIATALAGLVVMVTGWSRVDPIASLIVVALMVRSGLRLVGQANRIFLEAAPSGLDPVAIGQLLAGQPRVSQVHDLHVWEITSGQPALSAHVLVEPGADCHALRLDLEALLHGRFGVRHTTLQVDHAPAPTLTIGSPPVAEAGPNPAGRLHPPHE